MRLYENPEKTSENRLNPRSYYIPSGVSEYTLLNGTWDFAYFKNYIDVPDELVDENKIYLHINYKSSGVGSNACCPALKEEYRLLEKHIEFKFSLQPN